MHGEVTFEPLDCSHYPVYRLYVLSCLLLSLNYTPQVHPQAAGILPRQPPQKRRQCRPHCSHLRQAPGEEVQLLGRVAGAVRAGVGVSQLHGGVWAEPPHPHFGQGRHSHDLNPCYLLFTSIYKTYVHVLTSIYKYRAGTLSQLIRTYSSVCESSCIEACTSEWYKHDQNNSSPRVVDYLCCGQQQGVLCA